MRLSFSDCFQLLADAFPCGECLAAWFLSHESILRKRGEGDTYQGMSGAQSAEAARSSSRRDESSLRVEVPICCASLSISSHGSEAKRRSLRREGRRPLSPWTSPSVERQEEDIRTRQNDRRTQTQKSQNFALPTQKLRAG